MTRKDGFNLKTLFPSYNETYLQEYNYIGDQIILSVFTIVFCIIGLVGNGYIVWLLGFRIRRQPFATYILNLAVADFGFLVFLLPLHICLIPPSFDDYLECPDVLGNLLLSLCVSIYSSRQLLLTAFSIDRWVSVVLPNWYQGHQSPVLSTTLCTFLWVLSLALFGVPFFLLLMNLIPFYYKLVLILGQTATTLLCLFLVVISTLTLFIKGCLISPRCQCGNPDKVALLVLLSFFLFMVLSCASVVMFPQMLHAYLALGISLKSSINPLIYFLVGGQNGGQFQERMTVILQRVFKDERDTGMELHPRTPKML